MGLKSALRQACEPNKGLVFWGDCSHGANRVQLLRCHGLASRVCATLHVTESLSAWLSRAMHSDSVLVGVASKGKQPLGLRCGSTSGFKVLSFVLKATEGKDQRVESNRCGLNSEVHGRLGERLVELNGSCGLCLIGAFWSIFGGDGCQKLYLKGPTEGSAC